MPMPIIPLPACPDVPIALGVPPVLRPVGAAAAAIAAAVQLAVADDLGDFSQTLPVQWGIFDQDGFPVIVADSVLDLEFRKEDRIATAPQEQGAFMSYNKVATPFAGRVSFVQATSAEARAAVLQQVLDAEASLDLYILVMPEFSYDGVNVIHHNYRRSVREGVSMIVLDVWVEEVRVTGNAQFSNTASPQGAATTQNGQVQGGIDADVPQPPNTVAQPDGALPSPPNPSAAPSNPDVDGPTALPGSELPAITEDDLH